MTNQEAIEIIEDFRADGTYDGDSWDIDPEMNEALDMAIEALKAQEVKNSSDAQSVVICGACDNSESAELYLTNPPQIKCKRSGKLHFVTDRCDLPSVQPEKRTEERTETHACDLISRQAAIAYAISGRIRTLPTSEDGENWIRTSEVRQSLLTMPSVQPETIRCKDCKYFEYDHPYVIQGVPVLGHEICNAWGDGCKTNENGYCFLAERRTDESN